MFYETEADKALRFGDVLVGIPSVCSIMSNCISRDNPSFNIEVKANSYSVILTPCCSIKDGYVTISPLKRIDPNFYKNPFFEEDLTRINSLVPPEKRVPPARWDRMSDGEKEKAIGQGEDYSFLNYFIYESHDLLPTYNMNTRDRDIETNYYMVDFKDSTVVHSKEIITAEKSPLCVKTLQLTIATRKILRDKIINYYSRIPAEDVI